MIKVDQMDYKNFYKIFSELGSYTFMLSALDGLVKSDLYADDPQTPTHAALFTKDLNYLVGDLSNTQFMEDLYDLTQTEDFLDYTGFIFLEKNAQYIKEIFKDHTYAYRGRRNMRLEAKDFTRSPLSHDGDLVRITPSTLENYKDYANYDAVHEEAVFYWEEFQADSAINFVTALIKDQTIMASCFLCGESASENSCEIGVDTFEPFRRRGYADLVCSHTLDYLIDLGYSAFNWHCFNDNTPSFKTASKLGYKQVGDSHLCWLRKNLET